MYNEQPYTGRSSCRPLLRRPPSCKDPSLFTLEQQDKRTLIYNQFFSQPLIEPARFIISIFRHPTKSTGIVSMTNKNPVLPVLRFCNQLRNSQCNNLVWLTGSVNGALMLFLEDLSRFQIGSNWRPSLMKAETLSCG